MSAVFFGIAGAQVNEVVELTTTREQADQMLGEILRDEPSWAEILSLVRVDLGGPEPAVTPLN